MSTVLTKSPTHTKPLSLVKDRPLSLAKTAGTPLTRVVLGLGWEPASSLFGLFHGGSIDLDASVACCDPQGQVVDLVWFGHLLSCDGAIRHSGDNRTGDGEGDDEVITVDLCRLDPRIERLVVTITSWSGQTFDRVAGASCRLGDGARTLARYDLPGQGRHTALVMASLDRHRGAWDVTALGRPAEGRSITDLVKRGLI